MALSIVIVILLAYLLTDNAIMIKILSSSAFFQSEQALKRALEIISVFVLLIVILAFNWLAGVHFLVAVLAFSASRKRLRDSKVPRVLQGEPIILITAVFIALALYRLG